MGDYKISKLWEYFQIFWKMFTVIFIGIVCYQIIKIIVGGSWVVEMAVIGVLIGNTTLVVILAFQLGEFRKEFGKEIGGLKGEIGNLRAEFYKNLAEFSAEIRNELHEVRKDIVNVDKRVARIEHKLKIY